MHLALIDMPSFYWNRFSIRTSQKLSFNKPFTAGYWHFIRDLFIQPHSQCSYGPVCIVITIWSFKAVTVSEIWLYCFKCNYEVLPLSNLNTDDNGRHNVTNERALWARTPLPVRPLSTRKRSTSFYIFVLFSKGMRTKTRMLIRRIRRVLRDAGRNMEGATLNLLKRTNTAGKDGTEQKWPSASLKRHL